MQCSISKRQIAFVAQVAAHLRQAVDANLDPRVEGLEVVRQQPRLEGVLQSGVDFLHIHGQTSPRRSLAINAAVSCGVAG